MHPVFVSDMKIQNRKLVYRAIQSSPGQTVTRTQVGRATGISAPTVLKIFDFMERRGILLASGSQDSPEPGRRSSMFRFQPGAACAIGVSYDGRVLELSLVDLNFETVKHKRLSLDTDVSALIGRELPDILPKFAADAARVLGVGISLPASVNDHQKRIQYQAFPALDGRMSKENLQAECGALEARMGVPILLENDVNSAALAEYRVLELGDHEDLIYIMLGGGIGAGLVLDGRLRRGGSFSCGEIGYMVWDPNHTSGQDSGYLEDLLYRKTREEYGVDLLSGESAALPLPLISSLADSLALAIANLSNALDVSRFILGGRVAERLGEPLLAQINHRLSTLCVHAVSLAPSRCPDACARGAASQLILRELDALLAD